VSESGRLAVNMSILLTSTVFAYVGQTAIKYVLNRIQTIGAFNLGQIARFYRACFSAPLFWLGLATVVIGFLLWIVFLSRMDLSQAMPMLALSYIPWLLIGRFVFGEELSYQRVGGVVLIIIGVFLVGRSS
jgi:drug/metabolite transporter (DMT)-like permease